jgi:putative oxidoreductase
MNSKIQCFLKTNDDIGLTILRIGLGLVILPHGLQKTIGLFGGYGFSGTMGFFVGQGIPAPVAFLVILGESLGALGLIVGLGTRLAALGVAMTMAGAALMVHFENGFFMNWFGNQKGEGFEYHILALTMAVVLICRGAGKYSFDQTLSK